MDNFQKEIDERANPALSNCFELLLFRLGTDQAKGKSELFGINVFKLREIVPMQPITRAAGMRSPLLGMTNIYSRPVYSGDRSAGGNGLFAGNWSEPAAGHRVCAQYLSVRRGVGRSKR